MRLRVIFYYPYDRDLMALRNYYGRRFNSMMARSIRLAFSGVPHTFDIPDNLPKYFTAGTEYVRVSLSFNSASDEELVKWLESLLPRVRSMCVKNLMRYCYKSFPFQMFTMLPQDDLQGKPAPAKSARKKKTGMEKKAVGTEPVKEEPPQTLTVDEDEMFSSMLGALLGG